MTLSDELAGKFSKKLDWKSGRALPELGEMHDVIDGELRKSPNFGGLRNMGDKDKFTFRIYSSEDWKDVAKKPGKPIIFKLPKDN